MGAIYKIENLINHKVYIGKTSRQVDIRWNEHIRESLHEQDNIPIHNAIRKYGLENFNFQVLEDNILEDELNKKEKEYIEKYNSLSHDNGYNVTTGGDGGRTSSKLTEIQAEEIIQMLQDKNNLLSLNDIGEKYGISGSVVRAINLGNSWKKDNLTYPLRNYSTTGLTLTRDIYADIVNDILYSELPLKKIQEKYNLSESQLFAINQGQYCYNGKHKYYEGIYEGSFPIRPDTRVKTPEEEFIPIFHDVLFTSDSMAKIGQKYGVQGNTIQYITTGKRRKELTKQFLVPMRKHIEENREIFNSLYPNYKG